jgi:ubiquitin-protein ligase
MRLKRLKRDIVDIIKNPLNKEGIYYIHDEINILNGYALICGPKDTPYEYGYYLFHIKFPSDYPASPPTVVFCNQDRKFNTRFNPNLYRNGKVCLSILNTWKGEGWTSCITLRTILITLSSILNDTPLTNEPGIDKTHNCVKPYNTIINYRNIGANILDIISDINSDKYKDSFLVDFYPFKSVIIDLFKENYKQIEINIESVKETESDIINIRVYNMSCIINYDELKTKMEIIKIDLEII